MVVVVEVMYCYALLLSGIDNHTSSTTLLLSLLFRTLSLCLSLSHTHTHPPTQPPSPPLHSIQQSPVQIQLYRSIITDLPNIPFSLATDATDLNSHNLTGTPVTTTLTSNTSLTTPLQTCTSVVGGGWSNCTLVLPDVGRYVLRSCVVYNGSEACSVQEVGRDAASWAATPLDAHPDIHMLAKVWWLCCVVVGCWCCVCCCFMVLCVVRVVLVGGLDC